MKTLKEQVIELLETEINEVETGHDVYSKKETAIVLATVLAKVKDIPVEDETSTELLERETDDLKNRISRTIESFSFDFSYDIRNGNEIEAEVENYQDLQREIEGDIEAWVDSLTSK